MFRMSKRAGAGAFLSIAMLSLGLRPLPPGTRRLDPIAPSAHLADKEGVGDANEAEHEQHLQLRPEM